MCTEEETRTQRKPNLLTLPMVLLMVLTIGLLARFFFAEPPWKVAAANARAKPLAINAEIVTGGLLQSIAVHADNSFNMPDLRDRRVAAHAASNAKIFLVELDLSFEKAIERNRNFAVRDLDYEAWIEWTRRVTAITFELRPTGWLWKPETLRTFRLLLESKAHPSLCQTFTAEIDYLTGARKKDPSFSVKSIIQGVGDDDGVQTVCVLDIPMYESDVEDGVIRLRITRWSEYDWRDGSEGRFFFSLDYQDISQFTDVEQMAMRLHFPAESPPWLVWIGRVDPRSPEVIWLDEADKPLFELAAPQGEPVWTDEIRRDEVGRRFKFERNTGLWASLQANGKTGVAEIIVEKGKKRYTLSYEHDAPNNGDIPAVIYWPNTDPRQKRG